MTDSIPALIEPVINDGTDDAWQVIADALGNLGYDLNSHEETAAWVQQYLFRRPVKAEPNQMPTDYPGEGER